MTRVAVITPTWQRHGILAGRCVPSVQAQTYGDLEHVIVSDGPDMYLKGAVEQVLPTVDVTPFGGPRTLMVAGLPVRVLEVPDHDPKGWHGARARNYGVVSTTQPLLAFLDDDNAFRPRHLEVLVRALDEHPEADFAHGMLHYPQTGVTIGADPPQVGHIDSSSFVCRRRVFELSMWPLTDQYALDWMMIEEWLRQGARSVFVPEVTLDYYWPT